MTNPSPYVTHHGMRSSGFGISNTAKLRLVCAAAVIVGCSSEPKNSSGERGGPAGGSPLVGGTSAGPATGGSRVVGGSASATGGTRTSATLDASGGATLAATSGAPTGGTASSGGDHTGGTLAASGGASGGTQALGGTTSTSNAGSAGWTENFDSATSKIFDLVPYGSNKAVANVADSAASDGKSLQLTLAAGTAATPVSGTQAETKNLFQYGSFSARLRTVACPGQPNAGVVTGLFTFFNDGTDKNGDGLPDNSEIDFEWLCAEPQTVYLTIWTDYRDADAAQKRVSRSINLRTGTIAYTSYFQKFDNGVALSNNEAAPSSIAPIANYDSSTTAYVYGFDWAADNVSFWIKDPTSSTTIILWDYRGPASRIPSRAAAYIVNAWHTPDWGPSGDANAIQSPTQAVSAWVDWLHYQP